MDTRMSSADQLVNALFTMQQKVDPEADPGDLTILIQDDMPLVEVYQHGREGRIAYGKTVEDALMNAIVNFSNEMAGGT